MFQAVRDYFQQRTDTRLSHVIFNAAALFPKLLRQMCSDSPCSLPAPPRTERLLGGAAEAFMSNIAQTRSQRGDNREDKVSSAEPGGGVSGSGSSAGSFLLDLRRGTLTRVPPKAVHSVLVLISTQMSSLITLMTFGSSVIDLGAESRAELEQRDSPAENGAH